MKQTSDDELKQKIASQQSHSPEFRPGTRLDPSTAHELSRTGRGTPERDLKAMSQSDEIETEEPTGQNASGGRANR